MKPGDRVVIAFNPHDEGACDLVGTVVEFRPGAGFMGCDLVTVRYTDPRDGSERELPFGAPQPAGRRPRVVARPGAAARGAGAAAQGDGGRMTGRVTVPRNVLEGIEAVRRSGLTNMLDRPVVAELAEEMGFDETAHWVRANPGAYARGIFHGFEPTDQSGN